MSSVWISHYVKPLLIQRYNQTCRESSWDVNDIYMQSWLILCGDLFQFEFNLHIGKLIYCVLADDMHHHLLSSIQVDDRRGPTKTQELSQDPCWVDGFDTWNINNKMDDGCVFTDMLWYVARDNGGHTTLWVYIISPGEVTFNSTGRPDLLSRAEGSVWPDIYVHDSRFVLVDFVHLLQGSLWIHDAIKKMEQRSFQILWNIVQTLVPTTKKTHAK